MKKMERKGSDNSRFKVTKSDSNLEEKDVLEPSVTDAFLDSPSPLGK